MDHGGGHGGHDMPGGDMPKCSVSTALRHLELRRGFLAFLLLRARSFSVLTLQMNMLWNNQVADTCVVFRSWHISGAVGMLVSW